VAPNTALKKLDTIHHSARHIRLCYCWKRRPLVANKVTYCCFKCCFRAHWDSFMYEGCYTNEWKVLSLKS